MKLFTELAEAYETSTIDYFSINFPFWNDNKIEEEDDNFIFSSISEHFNYNEDIDENMNDFDGDSDHYLEDFDMDTEDSLFECFTYTPSYEGMKLSLFNSCFE